MAILVHDYLLVMRGAERTFLAMADMYRGAPVATLLYDAEVFGDALEGRTIRTSGLQRLGLRQRGFKVLMPVLPAAAERLRVDDHDLVLSSSSAFAHGVRPAEDAVHVCYCHTPFRYSWYAREEGLAQSPAWARPAVGRSLSRVRSWDRRNAGRGTHYVANGLLTQERLARYWGVDAPVVAPPVELDRFVPGVPEDYVLIVGELLRHKRFDLALTACRRAGVPVKVVGGGSDEVRLRALHPEAEFLGRVDDDRLAGIYARARCLVMPNVEEFGITAVEAQASGRPVVGLDAGGTRETVVDGVTGVLLPPGDEDALVETLLGDAIDRMHPQDAVANAATFSVGRFQERLREQIDVATRRAAVRSS